MTCSCLPQEPHWLQFAFLFYLCHCWVQSTLRQIATLQVEHQSATSSAPLTKRHCCSTMTHHGLQGESMYLWAFFSGSSPSHGQQWIWTVCWPSPALASADHWSLCPKLQLCQWAMQALLQKQLGWLNRNRAASNMPSFHCVKCVWHCYM